MTEIENGKYLPVLYTIPRNEIEIKLRNSKGFKFYLIPYAWIGNINIEVCRGEAKKLKSSYGVYVNSYKIKNYLSKLGKDVQEYYDRWFLNITTPLERPKCPICGELLRFISIYVGYRESCGNRNCMYTIRGNHTKETFKNNPDRLEEANRRRAEAVRKPETRKKLSEAHRRFKEMDPEGYSEIKRNSQIKARKLHPELNENQSKRMRKRYEDKKNRDKQSKSMSEAYKRDPSLRYRATKGLMTKESREKSKRTKIEKWKNPTESMLKSINPRGIKSSIFSPYENKEITFDSNWERSYFLECLKNPGIVSVIRCPFSIQYINPNDGLIHNYIPDFLVEYRDGSKILVEIKPKYTKYDKVVISKSKSAMKYCKDIGIKFIMITESEL